MGEDRSEAPTERLLAGINALLDLMGKTQPCRGKLTPAQVAEGMNAAARNAQRLLEDAELMLQAKRFPTAAALAVLAIEEAGKMPILRALSVARTGDALKCGWRDYRDHQRKNIMWLMPFYVLSGVRSLEGFRPLFNPDSTHPRRLDELKQLATYTDCRGKAEWSEPQEVVDELIAQYVVKTARALTKRRETSAREIELWVEHVGPSLEEASTDDLKRFWAAMEREGLNTQHIDDIDKFLGIVESKKEEG